jgi:hypothetical protein
MPAAVGNVTVELTEKDAREFETGGLCGPRISTSKNPQENSG